VALANLNALDELPANYSEYGDRFMLQNSYSMRSELELRKMFGTGFVEQIVGLEPGRWHGPVLSGYGPHLVMINSVLLTPQPAYIDIKKRLTEEWMAGQIDEMSERFVDELISRYEIIVEETEVPLTVPGAGAAE
jgi:peptidyl-prolyl cis-trans isomerase C